MDNASSIAAEPQPDDLVGEGFKVPTDAELLARVDDFLDRSGMKPTRFGLDAMGEGGLVKSLREGRSLSLKNVHRILDFIAEREAEMAAADPSTPTEQAA